MGIMPIGIYPRIVKDYGLRECVVCHQLFSKRPKQKPFLFKKQKCCSRTCNAKLSASYCVGKKAHNNHQVERICSYCGKKEMVATAFITRPYCSRECMAKDYKRKQKGENHWNWQGGITEKKSRNVLYDGYKEWRKMVFKRDEFRCVSCNSDKSGTLNAHHIQTRKEHPELLLDVNNGITLCKKCHGEIHYG